MTHREHEHAAGKLELRDAETVLGRKVCWRAERACNRLHQPWKWRDCSTTGVIGARRRCLTLQRHTNPVNRVVRAYPAAAWAPGGRYRGFLEAASSACCDMHKRPARDTYVPCRRGSQQQPRAATGYPRDATDSIFGIRGSWVIFRAGQRLQTLTTASSKWRDVRSGWDARSRSVRLPTRLGPDDATAGDGCLYRARISWAGLQRIRAKDCSDAVSRRGRVETRKPDPLKVGSVRAVT